jgi:hypothetical protein
VAKEFSQTFNGLRVKFSDVWSQDDEGFIAKATDLFSYRNKSSKNIRVENIPWNSLLVYK